MVHKMKKCKHGKVFCCECRYGKLSHIDHKERFRDAVTDMKGGIGFRITKGFYE